MVVGALCMAAFGISADAAASTRQIAPGGAFVPRYVGPLAGQSDRDKFSSPEINVVRVIGLGPSEFAYGAITMPVDSAFTNNTLTFKLRVFGGEVNKSQMCLTAYAVTSSGVMSAFTGSNCSTGLTPTDQPLSKALVLSSDSAAIVSIAGQLNSIAKHLEVIY
jgi:hypothetical protein